MTTPESTLRKAQEAEEVETDDVDEHGEPILWTEYQMEHAFEGMER